MALVRRAQDLPAEQLGGFMTLMLGSAVVGAFLEVPALVLGVRAVAYAWRRCDAGVREVVGSGPVPRAVALVGAVLAYRRVTSALMIRSLRHRLERAERDGSVDAPAGDPA